ncbi:hypothetical protein V6N00_09655 [Tersicoccus sp. MR15.9]|uniref:COG4705 family protein n=1 Tax=Tersicoccus mangrovi TaxID=3121635 RepID=UPI002FE545FD
MTTSTPQSPRAVKVPEPTTSFWVIKVLTTGMGEALSDFLVTRFDPVPVVLTTAVLFVIVLAVQFRARRYRRWLYWGTVAMVGVFGTMVADVVHVAFGIPYAVSTPVFLVALLAVFAAWRRVEGTLDVHTVDRPRREAFYWAAVVATFALGTSAGDLAAATLHLGYFTAALVFIAAMAVVIGLRLSRVLGAVAAFWTAYVLTRPVGASLADWLALPPARGGLGLGTDMVSGVAIVAIVVAVGVTAVSARRAGDRVALRTS